MEELKNKIRNFLGEGKKNQWLVFLLVGLIFLVIGIPMEEKETTVEKVTLESETVVDKADHLEKKLEKVLSKVEGVGKTSVLITLMKDQVKCIS